MGSFSLNIELVPRKYLWIWIWTFGNSRRNISFCPILSYRTLFCRGWLHQKDLAIASDFWRFISLSWAHAHSPTGILVIKSYSWKEHRWETSLFRLSLFLSPPPLPPIYVQHLPLSFGQVKTARSYKINECCCARHKAHSIDLTSSLRYATRWLGE